MLDSEHSQEITLRATLQIALLEEVTPNLVAVSCEAQQDKILLRFYFFESATEEEREALSCVETEIIAQFPAHYEVQAELFDLQTSQLEMLNIWVFLAKGAREQR